MYQTARTNQTVSQGYEVVYSSCTDRTEHYTEAYHTEMYRTFAYSFISVAFYHLCLIFASNK